MCQSTISPNKADQFGIKIAKDSILRSSNEVLTQKGVDTVSYTHLTLPTILPV